LADYREHYDEIRAAGASVAAISVDPPEKSEAVRQELRLPFPILCDTERRVVQRWDIYNAKEKGGIARPAVFIIDRDRSVRYHSIDTTSVRVPASGILRILQITKGAPLARRKLSLPHPADFIRAIRNAMRLGIRPPRA
jgi:peroxiredoxin